jgi:hypothetical protein
MAPLVNKKAGWLMMKNCFSEGERASHLNQLIKIKRYGWQQAQRLMQVLGKAAIYR